MRGGLHDSTDEPPAVPAFQNVTQKQKQKRMILDALRKVDIILYDLHACSFFSFLNV